MAFIRLILAVLCLVSFGVVANAQDVVLVTPIVKKELDLESPWLSELRTFVAKGDRDSLARAATEFLDDLNIAATQGHQNAPEATRALEADFRAALAAGKVACCDYRKNYYLLMFTAVDPQGKAIIANTLVHAPDPKSPALPGLKGPGEPVYELFIAEDMTVTINGYYEVKKTEDPAMKQTADFVNTALSKLGPPSTLSKFNTSTIRSLVQPQSMSDGVQPPPPASPPVPPPAFRVAVSLGSIVIPASRASLTGYHSLSVSDPLAHNRRLIDATAEEIRERQRVASLDLFDFGPFFAKRALQKQPVPTLTQEELANISSAPSNIAPPPPPASTSDAPVAGQPRCDVLITGIAEALKKDLTADACRYALSDQSDCLKQMRTTLTTSIKGATIGPACSELEARDAALAFNASVQQDLTKVSATNTLTNQPLQRYGFGLATGYLAGISTDPEHPKVSIQSGKISSDPFVRSITMGVVNLPLWGYDAASVGSSRVDLQACKLEYSIVSPK